MILKKQTVWLLTMLSLVVVLSVYYVTSPNPAEEPFAMGDEEKKEQADNGAKEADSEQANANNDGTATSGIASDDLFTALRLEIEEQRGAQIEELQTMMASSDYTAEDKNKAFEKLQDIRTLAQKESVLETMIQTKGYEDALVTADGDKVRVIVKAEEKPSKTAANDIMLMVLEEMGKDKRVSVEFQPKANS